MQSATGALVDLRRVTRDDIFRPTPCTRWLVGDLVAHMQDSADVAAEVLGGTEVPSGPIGDVGKTIETFHALLTLNPRPDMHATIGDRQLEDRLFLAAMTLEFEIHAWDLRVSLGEEAPVDDYTAQVLMPWCEVLIPRPRGPEFGPILAASSASPGARLLALLGRRSGAALRPAQKVL